MKRVNSASGFMKPTFSKNMRLAANGQKDVTLGKNKYGTTVIESKSPSPVRNAATATIKSASVIGL